MPAVLIALYDRHDVAERARTDLVSDGFPTDRVELTSMREPGHAGMIPAAERSQKFREYFRTLFQQENGSSRAESFADRVSAGGATVAVHPRGEQEIARARDILERHTPQELAGQALDDTALEHAAADSDRPLIEQAVRD
jgi:hypothetical protein